MPPSPPFAKATLAALLVAATACSPEPNEAAVAEPTQVASPDPSQGCLLEIWARQKDRDVAYDRAHDRVEGGSIACTTGTSASRFRLAIGKLRDASAQASDAALIELAGVPLTYIDARGSRQILDSREAVAAAAATIFDAEVRAALGAMAVERMAVADGGGSFRLGGLWLAPPEAGALPRLVTINRQALRESAPVGGGER